MAIHRYKNIEQRKNEQYKRTLTTQIPPVLKKDIQDMYIYTREGDRLDSLASVYYGDRTKWTYLAAANNLTELIVKPGIQLRIPHNEESIEQIWTDQNNNR